MTQKNTFQTTKKKLIIFLMHNSSNIVFIVVALFFVLALLFVVVPKFNQVRENSVKIIEQKKQDIELLSSVRNALLNQKLELSQNIVQFERYKEVVREGMPSVNYAEELYPLVSRFFASTTSISLSSLSINLNDEKKALKSDKNKNTESLSSAIEGVERGLVEVKINGLTGYNTFKTLLKIIEASPMIIDVNKFEYISKDGLLDAKLNFVMHYRLNDESNKNSSSVQPVIEQ